jgi:hypothetical protein
MRSPASRSRWLVALAMSALWSARVPAQECSDLAQQPSTLSLDMAFLGRLSSLTRDQIAAHTATACSSITAALSTLDQARAACTEGAPMAAGLAARADSLRPLRRFLCLRQEGSVPALAAIGRARADRPESDDSLTSLCAARTPQLSAFCGYSLVSNAPFPVCQALYSPDFASACSVLAQSPASASTAKLESRNRAKPPSAAMDSGVVFSATPR